MNSKRYRPCMGRSLSLCIGPSFLFLAALLSFLPFEKKQIFEILIVLFLGLYILVINLYSILKLNAPILIDESKISQKQYGKEIEIYYDDISNVKLSLAWYAHAPYAIKIYDNKKKIMFEITSKVFDEFMKCCSNIEVKNKIEKLFKEKEIY